MSGPAVLTQQLRRCFGDREAVAGIEVIAMSGPSSLVLALAASGLNGQNFAFVGYLPSDVQGRAQAARELETLARRTGQTQLFIETPYRNAAMLQTLLQTLSAGTRLAISSGLTTTNARTRSATGTEGNGASPMFEMQVRKHGLLAHAKLVDGEFIVQAGSLVRKEWIGQGAHNYKRQFEELVRAGILVEKGEHRVFAQSYAFSSPSAAGAMVAGRSCNGQLSWTAQGSGESYFHWEKRQLEVPSSN